MVVDIRVAILIVLKLLRHIAVPIVGIPRSRMLKRLNETFVLVPIRDVVVFAVHCRSSGRGGVVGFFDVTDHSRRKFENGNR